VNLLAAHDTELYRRTFGGHYGDERIRRGIRASCLSIRDQARDGFTALYGLATDDRAPFGWRYQPTGAAGLSWSSWVSYLRKPRVRRKSRIPPKGVLFEKGSNAAYKTGDLMRHAAIRDCLAVMTVCMLSGSAMADADTSQWKMFPTYTMIDLVRQGYEIKSSEHDFFPQKQRRIEVIYLQRGTEVARCVEITDGASASYPLGRGLEAPMPGEMYFHLCYQLVKPGALKVR
jgi:hypothetical protein